MKAARHPAVRFLAALLFILLTASACTGFFVVRQLHRLGAYDGSKGADDFAYSACTSDFYNSMSAVEEYYALVLAGEDWTEDYLNDFALRFSEDNSNFFFSVQDYDTGEVLLSNYSAESGYSERLECYLVPAQLEDYVDSDYTGAEDSASAGLFIDGTTEAMEATSSADAETSAAETDVPETDASSDTLRHVVITGSLRRELMPVYYDSYFEIYTFAISFFNDRYLAAGITAAGAVAAAALLVFLCCGAGRRPHTEEVRLRLRDRIPWDIFLLGLGGLTVLVLWLYLLCFPVYLFSYYYFFERSYQSIQNAAGLFALLALAVLTGLLSMAARCKNKGWWENSLLWKLLRHPLGQLGATLRTIPLIWKAVLFVAGLVAVGGWCVYQIYWSWSFTPIIIFGVLAALIILSAAACMQRLHRAGQAIAAGDLDYRVDTRHLYLDYRRHGEDLNHIGDGISAAVEQRLKSERFKTELITNVSHDLKTPLTSIVNYVDLLGRLELPEDARAYVEVLQRQSARLKKLTEDLVEASKASTGNLSVEIAPLNLSELVVQVTGEYETRFAQAGLTAVLSLPEESITALGDGRYLWRVMDNLLSNVCKYALTGTRVYISGALHDGDAVIAVKNISRERLNISAGELMERFVRGDASRNTEGSGLGLSIAQSLAQLMHGRVELTVDGDLFKAEVYIPAAGQTQ